MKKLFVGIIILVLASCSAPTYVVWDKNPNNVLDNCIIDLAPLNNSAIKRYHHIKDALVPCCKYNLGDTVKLSRKEFTNIKPYWKYRLKNERFN